MMPHRPILPARAIEIVDAKGLPDARTLLADFAGAGLIKTYALVRETKSIGMPVDIVRDAQIPAETWLRIVAEGKVADALSGGTVQLEGSHLHGGIPSLRITGVSFSEASLAKLLERYCETPGQSSSSKPNTTRKLALKQDSAPHPSSTNSKSPSREVRPIPPGALTASIAQTMLTTGLGRTKVHQLRKKGTLESQQVGGRVLITVESIRRLVGDA